MVDINTEAKSINKHSLSLSLSLSPLIVTYSTKQFYFADRKMALVSQTSNELVVLFDEDVRNRTREIYQAIPGTLIKYLEKKGIIKNVSFKCDFTASQKPMGTSKNVNFVDFQQALRKTIHESFNLYGVIEVRAEDLSTEISEKYQNSTPSRPDPGKSVSKIITFDQTFQNKDGDFWTNVNAHVYIYIEEECENNWFAADKRKFSYELTIKLNGIAVNKDKAIQFSQKVARKPVAQTIQELEEQYPLTWDDI
jgi:hypothetical protein